jgi:hypothetical protein
LASAADGARSAAASDAKSNILTAWRMSVPP